MGRLAPEKNVEALLKAWRSVRPEGCLLAMVGDGPLRISLPLASGEVLAGSAGILLSTENVAAQLRTILPILRDQPRERVSGR